MKTIVLKDIISDFSSNEQGAILFDTLKNAYCNNQSLILYIDSEISISSSFLNSSMGLFIDHFGLNNLKKTIRFQGSKNQFKRLSDYINRYSSVYA